MSKPATIIGKAHPFVKGFSTSLTACGVKRGDRILAGLSGGGDSVAMVRALAELAESKPWQLQIHLAHINHHLRPEADAEEQFVRDIAQTLQCPIHVRHIHPDQAGQNIEAAARSARYEQLEQISDQINPDHLATAHHADDQLETLLMRLIRGTTERGLGGIAARRPLENGKGQLIRPMLYSDHAEAIEYLKAIGQTWCEDESNHTSDRWRSELRKHVLPVLKRLRPDAAHKATEAATRLHSVAQLMDELIQNADPSIEPSPSGSQMARSAAKQMAPVILQSIIHQQCRHLGVGGDRLAARTIEAIAEAAIDSVGGSRRFDLAGGAWVEVTSDQILWHR